MLVDIYIRERSGSREIRVPWLPEKIEFKSGGTIRATYNIMDRGPVEVQTGSGLCEYSWKSEFPGINRTDQSMIRGELKEPSVYHNILEDWKAKRTPLKLLVVGYPINADVILDDYFGAATGGFGDIEYEVSFIEDRDITISLDELKEDEETTKRAATTTTSYTIKTGDTLWSIAQMNLGAGSKWNVIYDANKEIIEKTAKEHKKESSNNGRWIYPGTKLTIPQ